MLYGAFASSTLGMMSQAQAIETIGVNVANVNTGGYKRGETNFETLLSKAYDNQRNVNGNVAKTKTLVSVQGQLAPSTSNLDVAINGTGMFVLQPELGGGGQTHYGRDGTFHKKNGPATTAVDWDGSTRTVNPTYLVDKNDFFLQGYAANADGTFSEGGQLVPLRVDPWAFTNNGNATTSATWKANLPGEATPGAVEVGAIRAYDDAGGIHNIMLKWTRGTAENTWDLDVEIDPNEAVTGTISATPAGNFVFGGDAKLADASPKEVEISGTFGAANLEFTLNLEELSQYAGPFSEVDYSFNGNSNATMSGVTFDQEGYVVGQFSDATSRRIYKVPLATFRNPDGLEQRAGNLWTLTDAAGQMTLRSASLNGVATFAPNMRELSNVDLNEEFTRLLITQRAYSTSAQAMRTADEMTEVARDMA